MTKLSIITINYNDRIGLEKTIQSVVSQSFQDFEFIIIDGGSTDGSVDVIKKYADKLKCWVSEKDKGIYNAQNKGLKNAGGEYCLFLNSGDYLCDDSVLKNVFSINYTDDILYGDMKVDWNNGKITLEQMPEKVTLSHMYRDTIWHPVSFIKSSVFEKIGNYNEAYTMVADYEFFFRAIVVNKLSSKHLPFPISVFLFNGLSSNAENKATERSERLKVHKTYLTDAVIEAEDKKIIVENAAKRKWYNRIINKLKGKK